MSEGTRGVSIRRQHINWSDDSDTEQEHKDAKSEPADEIDNDEKQRDEFSKRLKDRDRNVVKITKSRADDDTDIKELRKLAREQYLTKREKEKFLLLKREVNELEKDVAKYGWENLTEKERSEISFKKEILGLFEKRSELFKDADSYQLPDDSTVDRKRKAEVLYSKEKYETSKQTRDQAWENQQIKMATAGKELSYEEFSLPDSKNYDFVFDEKFHVNFTKEAEPDIRQEKQLDIQDLKRQEIMDIKQTRESLPVYAYREQLLEAIKDHQVLIIVGETGSGKTTQLPQFLHEAGYTKNGKKVGCTQPRRVAAMSVASRVSKEVGCPVGTTVGYSIRFDDKCTDQTVIKYMTDGMLLREFLNDPELGSYSAMMIDEAHERTLHTDILLGLMKDICKYRKDLRLLISSATMNAEKFSKFFDDAPIFNVPGRRFPVDIHYTIQPEANYLQAAITTIFQIHTAEKLSPGDILVFLTGQDEIEYMQENISDICRKLGSKIQEMIVCPIYANLPSEMQQRIFEKTPPNARKVVLATNIAETSITIDGIKFVIDPGFVKENVYNPATGMESLVVTPCSQASADQRAGRAGRVGPGHCFRLYTKWSYQNELPKNPTPEILRTNLTSVVLLLLTLGINDLLHFDFMDAPSPEALMKSLELLYSLGGLNEKGRLTKTGRQMAEFPTDPMLARALLASDEYNCVKEVLTIVSMLGESSALFFRPKKNRVTADKAKKSFVVENGGDHMLLLTIFNQWVDTGYSYQWCKDNFLQFKSLSRARNVRDQLERVCDRVEILNHKGNTDLEQQTSPELYNSNKANLLSIQRSFIAGFFPNTAKLSKSGTYKSLKENQLVYIHPSSTLFKSVPPPRYVIYHELVLTSQQFMRNCIPVEERLITPYLNRM